MTRQPVDLPPIISVELIQISDTTNIPFAPKARKVIEKVKEEEKNVMLARKGFLNPKSLCSRSI